MPNDCCTLKKHKIVTTTHGDGNMYVRVSKVVADHDRLLTH